MTRRVPVSVSVLALLAMVFSVFSVISAASAEPCGPGVEAIRVDGDILCTHGDDEPPAGVDTTELPSTDELLEARFGVDDADEIPAEEVPGDPYVAAAGTVACIGDGVTGARVQLVYARAGNVPSRYSSVLPLLRQYASDADDIINVSAGRVGQGRRVRYVTNNSCLPEVLNITLSNTGDDSFGNMVSELRAKGLNAKDRKYLVFMDAAVGICGLGQVYMNDRGDEYNPNNHGYWVNGVQQGSAMFARVDASCWQYAAAHEMLHNLGAVQNSAPNSSGAGHCTDEVDVMCYRDTSTTVTRQVCSRAGQVDCNNNDYFHPNPNSGSYLDTNWNVARSRYLASGQAPPPPATTTVTVPSSGYAGVPWPVRVDVATSGASVVWSSTRSECWFAGPRRKVTTWTCPATSLGTGQITVHVTEDGMTTPYAYDVTLVRPDSKLKTSANFRASDRRFRAGKTISLKGRFVANSSGAGVAGLSVVVEGRKGRTSPWRTIKATKTRRNGVVRVPATPMRHKDFRVRAKANRTWAGQRSNLDHTTVSTNLDVAVNSTMVAGFSGSTIRRNTKLTIAGKVTPNKAGRNIRLQRYRNGAWRTIRSKDLTAKSRYNFGFTPDRRGKFKLRVLKPADRANTRSARVIRFTVG